ncbi:MAG: DUF4129 domain-containing protein, partial [Blastocatellia bacterium]
HVIGFDTSKQISMAFTAQAWISSLFSSYKFDVSSRWFDWVSELGQRIESWKDRGRGSDGKFSQSGLPSTSAFGAIAQPWALALLFLILASIAAFFWRRHGQSWRRKVKRDAPASAIAFYQEMLKTLERGGRRRDPDQTPTEFATRLRMPAVTEITNFYQQVRFGNQPLDDGEIARISVLLSELKRYGERQRPEMRYGERQRPELR